MAFHESNNASRKVFRKKTIFWPETKTETRAKKMSTALRTPASYLDVSKANILTAKEACLNLLSWDLRTVFTDALLVQSGCVNDSPEDEIRNWKSRNTTRYCDRGISDKNCYCTTTDNGVQHCREAVLRGEAWEVFWNIQILKKLHLSKLWNTSCHTSSRVR